MTPLLWASTTLPADVNPSVPEGQRWLADELAKPDYQDAQTLGQRILSWFGEVLSRLFNQVPSGPNVTPASDIWVGIAIALVIGVVVLVLSRIRSERRVVEEVEDRSVLGRLDLSAEQFRDRGTAALRDGRWNDAVVELTRAIARESADRTLLSDAPSLTAHEIGTQLAVVFPAHAPATGHAMDLFDLVRYGRYAAQEPDARHVATVERTLRSARPDLSATAAEPVGWSPPGTERSAP